MSLIEDQNNAAYQIKSFSQGGILVNDQLLTKSFIISPEKLIMHWRPNSIDDIQDADLLCLSVLKPDIILIGTGEKSIILSTKKCAVLLNQQYHVECMNTQAACRTYTVLASEGRNVVAGIIL